MANPGSASGVRGFIARNKLLSAVLVILVAAAIARLGAGPDAGTTTAAEPESTPTASATPTATPTPEPSPSTTTETPDEVEEEVSAADEEGERAQPAATTPKPEPEQPGDLMVVARVIDGDTVELANGDRVRVIGIDTPERGECNFGPATSRMRKLVEGKQVRVVSPDNERDRYGRLLAYLDVDNMDAGLRLIKAGLAISRYDSRDGYGPHPREARYIAADEATPTKTCAQPKPKPAPKPDTGNAPGAGCEPGYDPCVPIYPPDVNCADVNGPIRVTGPDPHGLDRDGDGIACE